MKRLMTVLGLATAISLFWVSPGNAAPTRVLQSNFIAQANWDITDTPALRHSVNVDIFQSKSGPANLNAADTTTLFEENRDTLHTDVTRIENVSSGFTFTRQQPLKGATLSGKNIPATRCTTDYIFGEPDRDTRECMDLFVDLSVKWVGVGETSRDPFTFHLGPPTVPEAVLNECEITFLRQATATAEEGTFGYQNPGLGDTDQAVLGTDKSGFICVKCPS
jgi:hypothetical protein